LIFTNIDLIDGIALYFFNHTGDNHYVNYTNQKSSLPDGPTDDKTRQDKTRQDKTRQDKTRQPPIILYQIDIRPTSALSFFKASLLYAAKSARWLNSALTHVLLLWLCLGSSLVYAQNTTTISAETPPTTETDSSSTSHLRANQPPVASLTVTPPEGKVPLLITADASGSSDPDGGIVKYEWSIGGEPLGLPEDVGTIKFTFQGEGNYLITVTVTDNQGLTATKQQKVKVTTTTAVVNQPPVANFNITPTQGEVPLTVNVDARDSSDEGKIASYQWKVSDGQTASGVKANFTFKTVGDYTLVLTVTDDLGLTATKQQTVKVTAKPVVNQPPVANFNITPTQGEVPLTVNVDARDSSDEGKIASYQWQVSDGQTASGVKANFTFDTTGNYTITLTVKDDKGATATQAETVEVIAKTVQPQSTNLPSLGENFMGGIAVHGQPHQSQALLTVNNPVEVTGNITVAPAHVGKTADIFVYVEAILPPSTDVLYLMLGEGLKTIAVWDKNPANLIPFQPNVTLSATQSVVMYTGPFVYLGTFKVFFGYRLPDGTMVASTTPITIITSNKGEPHFPGLVQLTPTDTDKVTLAWLPAQDDNTPPEAMTYQVHLSDQPNFTPSTATLQTAVTGQEKTEVTGLATGQTYNVLVVAVDQDGNESMERDYRTATTFADPVIVNPNTKTYVDTDVGLGMATTSDGVTFSYPNSGAVVPEIGSVLFSTVGEEMYLRKVTGVTPQGTGIAVQTEDAELAEVLQQATISNKVTLFNVGEVSETANSRTGLRTKRSLRADGSRHTVMEWPDKFLVATQIDAAGRDGEVSVSPGVRQGSSVIRIQRKSGLKDDTTKIETESEYGITVEPSIEFEPELETEIVWEGEEFKSQMLGGKVIARGTLTAKMVAKFDFKGSASVEKKIPFPVFTREYRSFYGAGPMPVVQNIKFTLDMVLSATAATKIEAISEAIATTSLETGIRYNAQTGQWDILPVTLNPDKSFTASLNAHGEVTGEIRLIPNIEVSFYEIPAADLSIEPFLKGKIAAELVSKADLLEQHGYLGMQLANFDFGLQAQGFIGLSLKVFWKKFPLLKKTPLFETQEWELFNLPKLEFAKENGNSTKVGEPLKLAVTVKDGANNPFNDGSIQWWVVPDTGAITPTSNRTATFVPSEEGTYTVFFSGASRIPAPLGRQFVLTEVGVGECGKNKPVASFTATPASGTAPLTVTLDASSSSDPDGFVVKYLWSSSDGQTAEGKSASMIFNAAGAYTVNLTVEDETGCKGTVLQEVTVVAGGEPKLTGHGIPDNTQIFPLGIKDRCYNGDQGNYITLDDEYGIRKVKEGEWIVGQDDGSFTVENYDSYGTKYGDAGQWGADCKPVGSHGKYVSWVRDGLWIEINYWGSGKGGNFQTITYVMGSKQGPFGEWNADGTARGLHGNYIHDSYDKKDGMWYCYDDKGKPGGRCSDSGFGSGKYVNDKREGLWISVNPPGGCSGGIECFETFTFVNGILQGPFGEWHLDGNPKGCHGEYANGQKVGVWTCYKSDGTIYKTETYVDGVKQ
jgi:PKD repeat protein